jgi:pimeloyl-ACP methyl ester carboxylesterase
MHNYKLIRYPLPTHGESSSSSTTSSGRYTRFDELLLEMVDLVRDRWGFVETDKFGLTGYSGGAQVCLSSLLYDSQ